MFGKINQLVMDNEKDRTELYKQSVLIFEKLRYKGLLDKLEQVSVENIQALTQVFSGLDEIEAYLYYEIVQDRLRIIEKLHKHVAEGEKEKVIQEYLYDHLWLLDPSWDRATETPSMEQNVHKEFEEIAAKEILTDPELNGRYDIKYKMTSGKHVIIELKRPDRVIDHYDLLKQVAKYRNALRKLIAATGKSEPVEVICLVDKRLSQWEDADSIEESKKTMASDNVRVVLYDELIEDAYRSYQAYLDANKEVGRIYNIIQSIETDLNS